MNDISSRITCKNKENRPLIPLTISAQEGLINQYDYFDKQIASINLSTYYVLKRGQFAYNKSYSKGYPYGAIKRLERYDEGALSSLYICFELKNIDSNFMCKYFDSNKWNYGVKLISGEGARNHGLLNLSPSDFFNIKLYVPTNKIEQLKIAKFIELLQEKIDISKAKLETLKKYKKGLQKSIFCSNRNDKFELLKNSVIFEPKSDISAGDSIDNGKYVLYKSGQKNGTLNTYTNEGIYIIANDGGEASFKLTNGRFSYTDHCICFKCESDEKTITLANYLQLLEKKITYIGFIGTGLKNIDRQYLGMIKIPVLEYKKIAKSFCEIDKAILNKEYKLECLLKLKKQLLQSMFI